MDPSPPCRYEEYNPEDHEKFFRTCMNAIDNDLEHLSITEDSLVDDDGPTYLYEFMGDFKTPAEAPPRGELGSPELAAHVKDMVKRATTT